MQLPFTKVQYFATVLVLSVIGCVSNVMAASQIRNLHGSLSPIASFDFTSIRNLGKDSTSRNRTFNVVGNVVPVDSPFGCAVEFDGKSRISVKADNLLDFDRSFSVTAWVNGSGVQFRTLEQANRRGPNFQVVGDRVYFVTNSDGPMRRQTEPKNGSLAYYYPSAIWSGSTDANLGSWDDQQRTKFPLSGLEPKLQVVGGRLFFEYFGGDAEGNWQIYTGTSGINGSDWLVRQRTYKKMGYASEQSRNIQVVGNKVYYAFPLKDKNGKWQLWTAMSNIDGSSWESRQQTTIGGSMIPSFRVSGDKAYYIFLSRSKKSDDVGSDVVIASANLDGSAWHEIRRVHRAGPWIFAQLAVNKGVIYYAFSKFDLNGNAHLWTGRVLKDGSSPEERQRTFGSGNATPAGIQVVGDKIAYSFSWTNLPAASRDLYGLMGMSFWIASTDLNGEHWVQRREIGDDDSDYLVGYKILEVVGGKNYYDLMRIFFKNDERGVVAHVNGILAYSGSNILNKGDSYGIGMSASGRVSGFVNAGEDYLYRGEAPEDTAGAMVEQKLALGWHHVAVTYDGNILRLYVGGKLARETRYEKNPVANPFPLSIGDGFVGKIAHVMLFDRALSKSEVSTLAEGHQTSCRPVVTSP